MVPAEPVVFTFYIYSKLIIRTSHNLNKLGRSSEV